MQLIPHNKALYITFQILWRKGIASTWVLFTVLSMTMFDPIWHATGDYTVAMVFWFTGVFL